MKMWIELFGSFAGQLSLAVILFMIGMAIFFIRLFVKKVLRADRLFTNIGLGFCQTSKKHYFK